MPPSVRYSMSTLGLNFRWATSSIAQRKSANRVGANTQPCLTPVSTEKASERRPLARTVAVILSWNSLMILINFGGSHSEKGFPIDSHGRRVTHTHTHTQPFYSSLTLSGTTRVIRYQKVHFAIFWIFWSTHTTVLRLCGICPGKPG